jgi:hypothetical protein
MISRPQQQQQQWEEQQDMTEPFLQQVVFLMQLGIQPVNLLVN